MKSPSLALGVSIGLLVASGTAFAQTQVVTTAAGDKGIEVLFDNAVSIASVRASQVSGFTVGGDPPQLQILQVRQIEAIDPGPETAEAFLFSFADLDDRPAFADRNAEYTVVIEGVLNAVGRPIGPQRLTYRHGRPVLSFSDPVRLLLGDDEAEVADARFLRFGGRRYLEVRDVVEQLAASFVAELDPYRPTPVDPSRVTVSVSIDNIDFRPVPVEGVRVNGDTLQLLLEKSLPKGHAFHTRVGLPKDDGTKLVVISSKPHTFTAPEGRVDSQYFVALSFVSSGTAGEAADDRDEEGILDLRFKPGPWPLADSGRGAWVRRWQPLLDAQVGTHRPSESESPNRVTAGVDLLFDRAVGSWGEHRLRVGLLHNSDRDFDTREAVVDLRWLPVPEGFLRSKELRLANARRSVPNARPFVRSWTLLPMIGVEYGEALARPTPVVPGEEDDFLRYKVGLEAVAVVGGRLTLSLSDIYRFLDEPAGNPADDRQNILAAAVTFQITALQGISLKFQKGNDVPTFDEVDAFSVSYELKH